MHPLRFQNITRETVISSTGIHDRENRKLTSAQRTAILQALLKASKGRTIKRGTVKEVAEQFNVERNTVNRIWKQGIEFLDEGNNVMDFSSRKKAGG